MSSGNDGGGGAEEPCAYRDIDAPAGSEVALALEDEQVCVLCRHLGFEVWWSC